MRARAIPALGRGRSAPRGGGAGAEARATTAGAPGAQVRPDLVFLRGRDADGRLRALEAERALARPLLGALAAQLIADRGWRALGFRSLGDFARERLGVGGRALAEWARVWRALGALPRLREAVLSGEVAWSVARLVVDIATPDTEDACLESVRGRTVRAVGAMLAVVKQAERGKAEGERAPDAAHEEGGAAEGEGAALVPTRIPVPGWVAAKWSAGVELARRVAGEPLPVWECAEVVAAEVQSALAPDEAPGPEEPLGRTGADASPGRATSGSGRQEARRGFGEESGLRHVAFPSLSWRPLARGGGSEGGGRASPAGAAVRQEGGGAVGIAELGREVEGCDAHELDRRLRAVIRALQRTDLELGRVLRQVVERRLHRELGFDSFERYVRERLDTSPRAARRLVRLARSERDAPRVADAFRRGRLTAFQADVVLQTLRSRPAGSALRREEGEARATPLEASREDRWLGLALRTTLRRLESEASAEVEELEVVGWCRTVQMPRVPTSTSGSWHEAAPQRQGSCSVISKNQQRC